MSATEAAQRGVGGSKEILLEMVDGLGLAAGAQIMVVELVASRSPRSELFGATDMCNLSACQVQ